MSTETPSAGPPAAEEAEDDLRDEESKPSTASRLEVPPHMARPDDDDGSAIGRTNPGVARAPVPERVPPPIAEDAAAAGDDATRPPSSALRYTTPAELYSRMPEIRSLTLHRPREGENAGQFITRLRESTTPEEAATFTAFAAQPAMAVWWGYGCLRSVADTLSAEDRGMMELVAAWSGNPDDANRWRVMKAALFAANMSPAIHLGLAVGWSGGPVAPNDPAPVPGWRAPRAINASVLSSIAHVSLQDRAEHLSRFIDLADKMFDVY